MTWCADAEREPALRAQRAYERTVKDRPQTRGASFLADACREAGFEPHVVALSQEPVGTRGMIARGLGVGWIPSLLAEEHQGIVVRAIDGPIRRRDIYALLPPGDRHAHARHVLAALRGAAETFNVHAT